MSGKSIELTIRKRYSCRSYKPVSLTSEDRRRVSDIVSHDINGPFGSSAKFSFFAAEGGESDELKGLGTYGFIKNPAAFITGVIKDEGMNLEDYGYLVEKMILQITDMGLGTCWLGGSFRRSRFAAKAGIAGDEIMPAVVSVGYIADKKTVTERLIRAGAGSDKRKKSSELFFNGRMGELETDSESVYGTALEMVRIAPSASNKQPWKIVKEDGKNIYHFFLERTPGYNKNVKPAGRADLQRVDMGIAMCHFESVVTGAGSKGAWKRSVPLNISVPAGWEYSVTWDGE